MSDAHDPKPHAGRTAIVTGGGSGIGLAIATRLAREGARVAILGRDLDRAEAAANALDGALGFACDVTDAAQVREAVAHIDATLGPAQILVNNAGAAESAPFEKTDPALFNRMLSANLTGVFLMTQAALPAMKSAGWGRIVSVASTAGLKGYAYVSAYSAAKHGVIGLTRSLALETARSGVTVNAVCPGFTETPLLERSVANIAAKTGMPDAEARASLAETNPQGRLIAPEDVADTVSWLASDGAHAITGQAVAVAGGEVMVG